MLKITYLDNDIYLEHLPKSLVIWKSERILLNLRATASIFTESSIASLVLPANLDCFSELIHLAEQELIEVIPCDEEYVEVSLSGTWIAQSENSELGIFVCEINHKTESLIAQLWQESQIPTPAN